MTAVRDIQLPPAEVIKADPATCRHSVLDEMVGVQWGFEDCVTCGKRFPMRDDCERIDFDDQDPSDFGWEDDQ